MIREGKSEEARLAADPLLGYILRMIVADIVTELPENGPTPDVMRLFYSLITINAIHSREEERLLFEEQPE